jgi:hypothetical protein
MAYKDSPYGGVRLVPHACYCGGVDQLKAGLTSSALWGRRSKEVLSKRLALLVATAMMVLTMLVGSVNV